MYLFDLYHTQRTEGSPVATLKEHVDRITASLLISKLQSQPQKNAPTKALQEYGRLNETIFILKYLQTPEYQK